MRTVVPTGALACGVLLVLGAAGPARSVEMVPGEWEVTSTGSVEGVGEMPPQTNKTCLAPDDLVPKSKDNTSCTVREVDVDGNRVSWKVSCEDPESGMKGEGEGSITYSGETFEGSLAITMTPLGQASMQMRAQLRGRRIGACPEM